MKHVPRPGSRKGGGVALLYKSTILYSLLGSSTTGNYTNFEYMDCILNTGDMAVRLPVVYPDIFKHYRPESNLPFISKVLEKVVDTRIQRHLLELQSVYS
jgi:hypothetical protein